MRYVKIKNSDFFVIIVYNYRKKDKLWYMKFTQKYELEIETLKKAQM